MKSEQSSLRRPIVLALVVVVVLVGAWMWMASRSAHIQRQDGYVLWVSARTSGRDLALLQAPVRWLAEGGCFVGMTNEEWQPVMFPPGTRMVGGGQNGAVVRLPGVANPVTIGAEPLVLQGTGGGYDLPSGFEADDACWSAGTSGVLSYNSEVTILAD